MKIRTFIIITSALSVALLSGCEKTGPDKSGSTPAIKLTVSGVETKAKVITDKVHHSTYSSDIYDYIETYGFNISAYVTKAWHKEANDGTEIAAGPFVDPGYYDGVNPAGPQALKDIKVTYNDSRDNEKWRITGNEGANYADHRFSWVNNVPMTFFAYAPALAAASGGTLSLGPVTSQNADNPYNQQPFTYTAKATSDQVTSANCEDLIFAFAKHTATYGDDPDDGNYGKLVSGSSDKFDLTFYHALAQIRFCVDPVDFTTDNITLLSAKLLGPKNTSDPTKYNGIASKGGCTFTGPSTFTWDNTTLTNRYAYIQNFGTSGVSFASEAPTGWTASTYGTSPDIHNLYTCAGDVLFVIPQTLEDCGVEVKIQVGTDEPVLLQGKLPATTSTSTNVSWAAGYYYTYKIGTVGTQEDLGLTMTLVDWAERESYIPIN